MVVFSILESIQKLWPNILHFFPTLEKLLNKLIIKVDVDDVDVYIDNWTSFY